MPICGQQPLQPTDTVSSETYPFATSVLVFAESAHASEDMITRWLKLADQALGKHFGERS
jgi:hypothetical protein